MADPRSFHFGDCVVDVAARTVLRGGRPQAFEPKVFDTLVYLIEQRARVVPKQELLERVWGTRVVVTEGVIARTIMKLRRLLGDDADKPALVKTVHRVGYRFAGEVSHEAPPLAVAASRATRVAVLPFVNRSGSDALAWTDFGLMTATCQALQEGGIAGRGVGHDAQIDGIQVHALAAGQEIGRFGAGDVHPAEEPEGVIRPRDVRLVGIEREPHGE